ncbi:inositol monophosphatase family protein [Lyngbya confervoides]|uniref:Inositol monophosphatase family protein n=1 Tax=Lyngbya confervoides BDU141951 TaxID=1574623 RepID=A0ABD4T8A5_9CYAN|nr:inositol monophosphatase family protein [Lyngbya confervoides]MCM1984698.1 inositol monophosphatase family protein [Lyngbya confervoides BDU141951]
MLLSPTPQRILATLFPLLQSAAAYACRIQAQIQAQPDKGNMPNFFAAALSDADLSIQTLVEVALLGVFPEVRFFGEEYEQSFNTPYFRSIELGANLDDDYLVTLDPIDGTRFYLDGHSNFQIILAVLDAVKYQAVLAISPAKGEYFYSFHGQGTRQGTLDQPLEACQPLQLSPPPATVLLGVGMQHLAERLQDQFTVISIAQDYGADTAIPNVNGILSGELSAAVLAAGNWIDGGAIAFLAQEAGCWVSDLQGDPLPPLRNCKDKRFQGIIIATSPLEHQQILEAIRSTTS